MLTSIDEQILRFDGAMNNPLSINVSKSGRRLSEFARRSARISPVYFDERGSHDRFFGEFRQTDLSLTTN